MTRFDTDSELTLPNRVEFKMIYDGRETVTRFSPDRDIYEVYEYFEEFLIAMGFAKCSIDQVFRCDKCNPREDKC